MSLGAVLSGRPVDLWSPRHSLLETVCLMCQQQHQKERAGGREKRSGEQDRVTDSVKYKYGLCLHYTDRCRNQKPKCYKHNGLASRTSTHQREHTRKTCGQAWGTSLFRFWFEAVCRGLFFREEMTPVCHLQLGFRASQGIWGPSHKQREEEALLKRGRGTE